MKLAGSKREVSLFIFGHTRSSIHIIITILEIVKTFFDKPGGDGI